MKTHWGMLLFLIFLFLIAGCGLSSQSGRSARFSSNPDCAPFELKQVASDAGIGKVFLLDPIFSFKEQGLRPTSEKLRTFGQEVPLSHLSGEGVLKGRYLEVLNGLQCSDNYGAFEAANHFSYTHDDFRFQEVMTYYYGDLFRSQLEKTGYLRLDPVIKIVAHCELEDNAYFVRSTAADGQGEGIVCLGDSNATPGASYADDPVVAIHEMQHAATMDNYSPTENLGQLWYDEAGALNEAISDFMGLVFEDPWVSLDPTFDPRIFSRWALGTFSSKGSHVRGAHRCPMYDSSFPNCDQYPNFATAQGSQKRGTVSYVYPDGMGWPFPNNFQSSNPVLEALEKNPAQEEIHNAAMVALGALWDVYDSLKKNHNGDLSFASTTSAQLVMEALRHLPQPNQSTSRSPVTFIDFAESLVDSMPSNSSLNAKEQEGVRQALKARGLYQADRLEDSSWMAVGKGINSLIPTSPTPGVYINDDPAILQRWLMMMGADPMQVSRNHSAANHKLDPGEVAAVWFDIENHSPTTAGGVMLTVTSNDPDLKILGGATNIGYLEGSGANQTQIMYGKINGTRIASALPVGNSYFKTNLYFNRTWRTAVWVEASSRTPHGKVIPIQVQAVPSNGAPSTQTFEIVIP